MGDVKVASVTHAVAPMAAAPASAQATSVASVAAVAVAPVAMSEVAQESQEREEAEPVKIEVVMEMAAAEETTATENALLIGEEAKREAAEVAPSVCDTESNGAVRETMEIRALSSEEQDAAVVVDAATPEPDSRMATQQSAEEEASASGAGEGESDGVAVAPVSPAALKGKCPPSPSTCPNESTAIVTEQAEPGDELTQKEEEELVANTSVEEQSPEVICLDGDTQEDDDDDDEGNDTVGSELSAVDETAETLNAQQTSSRRKRKRAKVHGFSSRKGRDSKPKRNGVTLSVDATAEEAAAPAPPTRARRQRSGEIVAVSAAAVDVAPTPATSSSEAVTWDWKSCSVFFDPLTQASMDELSAVRRENAQVVAANSHLWQKMRRFDNDDTYLAVITEDAGAEEELHRLRFRPVIRGRAFRDAWEEEDFLLRQRKPVAIGRGSSKKRPFAGCDGISSYRKLVRGFDDDQFDAYIQQLEANAKRKAEVENGGEMNGSASPERIESSPPRRLKTAKRPAQDLDTLPPVPVSTLHPAACGSWKLKGKETPSFDSIHPASIRSAFVPQRWVEEMAQTTETVDDVSERPRRSGRRENGKQENDEGDTDEGDDANCDKAADDHLADEVVELPSFGLVVDEDEVSHEIDNSILRLLEVSAFNWRHAQAVYERAVAHIEVTPLLVAEESIKLRLESLYRKIYPPIDGDQGEVTDAPLREWQLMSKPKDIVAYAVKPCGDMNEVMAVAASVEYAVRLKKGDAIDVLDRNGCWNDGVVIDVLEEAGVGMKYVLVSYTLWGDDSSEWVSIADGRVLPRGVADGRINFKVAPSSIRKKRVDLNKSLADLLQRTYPSRLAARAHLGVDKEEVAKQSSKKQRRQH